MNITLSDFKLLSELSYVYESRVMTGHSSQGNDDLDRKAIDVFESSTLEHCMDIVRSEESPYFFRAALAYYLEKYKCKKAFNESNVGRFSKMIDDTIMELHRLLAFSQVNGLINSEHEDLDPSDEDVSDIYERHDHKLLKFAEFITDTQSELDRYKMEFNDINAELEAI